MISELCVRLDAGCAFRGRAERFGKCVNRTTVLAAAAIIEATARGIPEFFMPTIVLLDRAAQMGPRITPSELEEEIQRIWGEGYVPKSFDRQVFNCLARYWVDETPFGIISRLGRYSDAVAASLRRRGVDPDTSVACGIALAFAHRDGGLGQTALAQIEEWTMISSEEITKWIYYSS
jgi:hypothetical protein